MLKGTSPGGHLSVVSVLSLLVSSGHPANLDRPGCCRALPSPHLQSGHRTQWKLPNEQEPHKTQREETEEKTSKGLAGIPANECVWWMDHCTVFCQQQTQRKESRERACALAYASSSWLCLFCLILRIIPDWDKTKSPLHVQTWFHLQTANRHWYLYHFQLTQCEIPWEEGSIPAHFIFIMNKIIHTSWAHTLWQVLLCVSYILTH